MKRRPTRYGLVHLLWCMVAAFDTGKAWRIQLCYVGRKYPTTNWGIKVTLNDRYSGSRAADVLDFVAKALLARGWYWSTSKSCMESAVGNYVCRVFCYTQIAPETCHFSVIIQPR